MYLEIITTPQVNVGGVPTVLCQRCANVGSKNEMIRWEFRHNFGVNLPIVTAELA